MPSRAANYSETKENNGGNLSQLEKDSVESSLNTIMSTVDNRPLPKMRDGVS
jgi:hypothetical protein